VHVSTRAVILRNVGKNYYQSNSLTFLVICVVHKAEQDLCTWKLLILRSCDRATWNVTVHRDMWLCIVTCDCASWHVTVHRDTFLTIKPTIYTNFSNLFWKETLHVSESSSVHHQELFTIHSAMIYVIQVCRQLSSRIRMILLESCLHLFMTYLWMLI
jgi:hypothetical protein